MLEIKELCEHLRDRRRATIGLIPLHDYLLNNADIQAPKARRIIVVKAVREGILQFSQNGSAIFDIDFGVLMNYLKKHHADV